MRLIDADALITWFNDHYDDEEFSVGYISGLIKDAPTVDIPTIEPQRIKGRWLKKESVGRWDDTLWECSKCGCLHSDNVFCISGNFNFCPNCGADMR